MRSLILEDEAKADVNEAHDWYEEQLPGLGARFESHLNDTFVWIDENVGLCREFRPGVRRHNMMVFPYSIYFTATESDLRVIGVLHGAQNPKVLDRRIGQ